MVDIGPVPDICPLEGYWIACSLPLFERHHLIGKNLVKGNDAAREYIDAEEGQVWVCKAHNGGKWADSRVARAVLLLVQVHKYGEIHMREWLAGIPWKVPQYEYTFDGIMAAHP